MSVRESWAAYAAALWSAIFAILHLVWATGWYVGLQQEFARRAFEQPWFLIYDLVVAGVFALGACVALALAQPWGLRLPRRPVGVITWCGAALLALRGGAGVLQTGYLVATGRSIGMSFWIWDVWFCLGAVLFGLTSRQFWRASGDLQR